AYLLDGRVRRVLIQCHAVRPSAAATRRDLCSFSLFHRRLHNPLHKGFAEVTGLSLAGPDTDHRCPNAQDCGTASARVRSGYTHMAAVLPVEYEERLKGAVSTYWKTLRKQRATQEATGKVDVGGRADVTGGKHMDGFGELIRWLALEVGM